MGGLRHDKKPMTSDRIGAALPQRELAFSSQNRERSECETPDTQDAICLMLGGWTVNYAISEANAMRSDAATRGQLYLRTKSNLLLVGGWEIIPEMKIDPVNDISRFHGHPIGGPVYTDVKPTPWMQASKGGVQSESRYGTGGEDTMAMNERDWLNSIRTRKRPLCDVEYGQRVNCI
jgi:hypothetical protein